MIMSQFEWPIEVIESGLSLETQYSSAQFGCYLWK